MGATVEAIPVKGRGWGLQISGAGMASAIQDKPVQLEFWSETGRAAFAAASYDDWSEMNGGFRGKATLDGPGGCRFNVEDHWHLQDPVLRMARTVSVVRHAGRISVRLHLRVHQGNGLAGSRLVCPWHDLWWIRAS